MSNGVHVSINAESLFHLGGLSISNSILTSIIVSGLIIGFALLVRSSLKPTDKPTGLQSFAEWLVESLYTFVHSVTGDSRKSRLFMPLIATFFIFILVNNWFGLLPGVGTIGKNEPAKIELAQETSQDDVIETTTQPATLPPDTEDHGPVTTPDTETPTDEVVATDETHAQTKFVPFLRAGTADLNTTIALALISFVCIQAFGFKFQSFSYLKKFFNFSSPIFTFVGLLEIVGEFAKIISFAFRLFGNVFAGEVLLVVISSLIAVIVPVPFYGLEVFVGFIQALVFSMLTLIFINMATASHSSEH